MPLTLEERGALVTLAELAAERGGFVPDQERWLAGWMQCSVRKWRVIRSALIAKGKLAGAERGGEAGFTFESEPNQSRTNFEPTSSQARKVAETETKPNEINEASRIREARVGDNNLPLEDTCSGGGGVERERASPTDDWPEGDLGKLLVDAADSPWLDPQKTPNLIITAGRIAAWKRRGASWSQHVLPVVTALAKLHGEPIATWQFFEKAIGRAVKSSRADMDLPEGVVPLRPGGGASITDRIAAENAEARRLAFAMLDRKNGQSN
jgi:hypothetical protein